MKECEKCKRKYPWYLISQVQIWSREFIGEVSVCDFCYTDFGGERLRKYGGFDGWIRKKLVKLYEKKHSNEITRLVEKNIEDDKRYG